MAEQFRFEQVLGDGGAVDRDEAAHVAPALVVDETGQQFLAGAGLAGDHHARVALGDLLGHLEDLGDARVARDDGVVLLGHRRQHGGDQFGLGGQGDVFARAGLDRAHGGIGVGADAAGDHGDAEPLGRQAVDQGPHIVGHVDHHQIGALARAQRLEPAVDRVDMDHARALRHGDAARGSNLPVECTDDEQLHPVYSLPLPKPQDLSVLMISVIVTPSRSSTTTTSPRATNRLLT